MRKCTPFAEPSSIDDIKDARSNLDEIGGVTELVAYISTLIRSQHVGDVMCGIDIIEKDAQFEDMTHRCSIEFLAVLGYFRLAKYDKCLKRAQTARDQGYASKEMINIMELVEAERKAEKVEKASILAGVGATVLGVGAIVLGAIFGKKRK